MSSLINPLITDAGLAAAIAASGSGLQLAITHIALGAGQYTPSTGLTSLSARKEKVAIPSGYVTGSGGFRVNALFPSWTGTPNPYNATEIGFYAGDPDAGGILFAVHSHASAVIVQRNSLDYVVQFSMQLTRVPAGSVTVTVDPGASQMLALMADHEADPVAHPQYALLSDIPTLVAASLAATDYKASVRATTTANIASLAGGAPSTLDGVTLVANDRILVKDQSTGSQNGIYYVATLGTGANGTWTRSTDADGAGDLTPGAQVTVEEGSTYADSIWELTTNGAITIGTTALAFARKDAGAALGVPTGAIFYVPATTAPTGYIKANGSLLSRSTYATLWAYAQTSGNLTASDGAWTGGQFSPGDGSTTFRIPDLRGEFIRGYDDGRGIDTGRVIGSWQAGDNASHTHGVTDPGHAHTAYAPSGASYGQPAGAVAISSLATTGGNTTGISIVASGSEARPRNVAELAIIKY